MLVLRHVFCIFSIQNTCLACGTRVIYLYTQPATLASKYMLWIECICKMLVSNYIRYKKLCSMLSPHYISTRPAMLASRYILSATFWIVLWKGLDRENLPSLSFQFCIHFLLCCIHVHSFPINLFSVSIHVLWFCIHFVLISICFLSFFLHLLPFWAFISFHVPFMSFLHSFPSTLTIISF